VLAHWVRLDLFDKIHSADAILGIFLLYTILDLGCLRAQGLILVLPYPGLVYFHYRLYFASQLGKSTKFPDFPPFSTCFLCFPDAKWATRELTSQNRCPQIPRG
jgi:hypothetical protein